ncbi:Hypothetical predicted protein [Octopus vulgaris]|uniref:Uncharacterized protein n=1 Tax=Octopus vulgaris TaxID=6645 RepID=A0AA36FRG1_OCTVU|nr:Hypothetical predicted protein [Octopus vulgaris]
MTVTEVPSSLFLQPMVNNPHLLGPHMDSSYSELQKSLRKCFETENVVSEESATLHAEIPNMETLMIWKCPNYNYECDGTCSTGPRFQVTNPGGISSLWIRNVTKELSSRTFYGNNLNIAKTDLKINNKPNKRF